MLSQDWELSHWVGLLLLAIVGTKWESQIKGFSK
jgi:hypothetical protein